MGPLDVMRTLPRSAGSVAIGGAPALRGGPNDERPGLHSVPWPWRMRPHDFLLPNLRRFRRHFRKVAPAARISGYTLAVVLAEDFPPESRGLFIVALTGIESCLI